LKITQDVDSKGKKWWAWKDSNLRPADYEDWLASFGTRINRSV